MLANVWRVAFHKGTQLPNKPMKVIAGFLGEAKIGMWQGERLTKNNCQGFVVI